MYQSDVVPWTSQALTKKLREQLVVLLSKVKPVIKISYKKLNTTLSVLYDII